MYYGFVWSQIPHTGYPFWKELLSKGNNSSNDSGNDGLKSNVGTEKDNSCGNKPMLTSLALPNGRKPEEH